MLKQTRFVATLVLLTLSASSNASPQESVTYFGISSDGLLGATVNATTNATFVGGYTAYKIRLSAQITEVNTNDFASEGRLYVTPPSGPSFVLQPFTVGSFVGSFVTTANGAGVTPGSPVEVVFNLPQYGLQAAGTWSFRFYESLDDAGTDKTWDTITITLDDQPPSITNIGSGFGTFNEVEINDINTAGPQTVLLPNPNFNSINTMISGSSINGLTSGSTTNGSASSIDYYLIQTAPDPFGNYSIIEHTLTISTGSTAGHTGHLRGRTQLSPTVTPQPDGFPDGRTDIAFQTSSASATGTTPARTNKWYGFAKGESVMYSISGTTATTASYTVSLTSQTITPIMIPGPIVSGPITIARAGHTNTVDFILYDFNYDPVPGGASDGTNSLTRTLVPGIYYLAVSNQNTANNLPTPADSTLRTGNVQYYPDTVANSSNLTLTNLDMQITSGAGTVASTGAAKSGGFSVVWMTFTVSLVDCNSNGINDSSEPGYMDCNTNGTMDSCEITSNPAFDCNTDTTLDTCQLSSADCNANGTPDSCDLLFGAPDCDSNNTPDSCELVIQWLVSYNSIDIPKNIPDNSPSGASSLISVPDSGSISDVNVMINVEHTFDGDLIILLSHGSNASTLSNRRGGTGENFTNTVFDDEASAHISTISASGPSPLGPPHTGTFRPESLLSALDGSDKLGSWSLSVVDAANLDTGTILAWSLLIDTPMSNDCDSNGVPDQCQPDANSDGTPDDCEVPSIVPTGIDCWATECGQSQTDFRDTPIPCGFFDPGSEPFDGIIHLGGGDPGNTDTRVQRLAPMNFDPILPDTVQVPIELVSLNLVSCQPITIRYSNGQPDELWNIQIDLSLVTPPPGQMTVTKTHANGGFFTSQFFVQPRFTFTRISDNATRQFDTGLFGFPPIPMQNTQPAPWVHVPSIPVGPQICGINFVPGVQEANVPPTPGSNCTSTTQCLKPVGHGSGMGHLHVTGHTGAPCPCGACCDPGTGICTEVSGINPAAICSGLGGSFKGVGSSCISADGDSIPDSYETSVPCSGSACVSGGTCSKPSSPARADTDGDGVSDSVDSFPFNPCLPLSAPNRSAVCDLYDQTLPGDGDCDNNGTCDYCQIHSGAGHDSNGNGVPDGCEPDCNSNGLPDSYDLGVCGSGIDANSNGTLDVCETPTCTNAGDMNGDNLVDGDDVPDFLNCLIGSSTNCACGDMNGSGAQDVDDVQPFVLKLLGMFETYAIPFTFPATITTDSGPQLTTMSGELKLMIAAPGTPGMRSVIVSEFTFGTGSVPTVSSETGGMSFLLIDGSGTGFWHQPTGQFSLAFSHHVASWLLDETHPPVGPTAGTNPKDDSVLNTLEIWNGLFEGTATLSGGGSHLDIVGTVSEAPPVVPLTPATDLTSTISTTTDKKVYTIECKKERCNKRKICVQPVFVKDNATDGSPTGSALADYKAATIEVWAKCCVEVMFMDAVTVVVAGGKDINDINTHGGGTDESSPKIDNLRKKQDEKGTDMCVEIFFVSTMSNANGNAHEWGDGVCYGAGMQAKIIVADQGGCNPKNNQVCAHELGHAMGLEHPDPSDGSCMDPTGNPPNCAGVGTKKIFKGQCTDIKSDLLKPKDPKEECCKSYDE